MHKISIHYCSKCNWLPRSTWIAQELLHTFAEQLQELALVPAGGGEFYICIDEQIIWNRQTDGFPDIKSLRQRLRDIIDPSFSLGHGETR